MVDNGKGSSRPPPEGGFPSVQAHAPPISFPLILPHPYKPGPAHIPPVQMAQQPELYPGDSWKGWYEREPYGMLNSLPQTWGNVDCSHSRMVRQFVGDRILCPNCSRRPFLGWLLVCVEDFVGHSDRLDPNGPRLSRGISQAILAGHYTPEEKAIVIQQKERVIQHVEELYGPAPSSLSQIKVIHGVEPRHPTNDSDDRPHVETIEDISEHSQGNMAPHSTQPHRGSAACRFSCCHHCRKYHYQRTYISLDAFCNDPRSEVTLPWEFGRRVSDVRIIRGLDNHYEQREHLFSQAEPHPMTCMPLALRRRMYPSMYRTELSGATQQGGSYLRRNIPSLDLRALYSWSETTAFSDAGRAVELSDSESEPSLSIGSTTGSVTSAKRGGIPLFAAEGSHHHKRDSEGEHSDDDYGLLWLFQHDPDSHLWPRVINSREQAEMEIVL